MPTGGPVPRPDGPVRCYRPAMRALSPRTVGLAVLVVGVVVALLPGWVLPARWLGPADASPGTATLPPRFADYSYLTGSVSASPPGRAIAVYQHGFGVEFMDFPQAVVAGADGDVYRRLDVAERRAGGETQGDPAVMQLSPDGTRVAVGDWVTSAPDIAVVDLTTGDSRALPVPGGRSAIPLAWSPDATLLAPSWRSNSSPPATARSAGHPRAAVAPDN